ncbi:MAG: hypothetical protein KC729_00645, partial [Candidatus Eisenbacteria bacterium]|nr:hypothetical protein [Candidatus Eisenbacteria bacterium]
MNGSRSPLALILGLIFVTTIGWSTAATRAAAAGGFAQPPGSSAAAAIERVGAYPYGPALAVAVDPVRKLIFLGSGGAVLVLDGSDVTAPSLLYDEIRTYGLVLDAAYDEATQRLYLACGEGGLEIWDLAEPTAPVRLSHVEVTYFGYDTPVGTVVVHGHFCVVECEWGYVHALDVSDPTHPVQVGFNGTMGNPARDIYLSPEDDTIHTTGAQNWVRLYLDGTGTLYSAGDKHFTQGPVAVAGTPEVSYVGYAGYLYIIDLLDPRLPFWSETFVGGIGDIVEEDGFIYFTNSTGLHVWDTRTYNDPVLVGSAGPDLYDYRLALADGYVYVAAGSDGLRIYQTAPTAAGAIDPQAPVLVGTFPSLAVTWDTIVSGDVAYLSHSLDGTFTLDLENLEAPERIGESPSFGETRDAALAGNVLYVADWTGGVRILDVSDPTDPTEIGVFDGASAWRVAVENGILYVIDGVANEQDTLYSIDVSDPANPVVLDSFRLGLLNWDLLLVGSFLYVGGGDDGVRILDVSDPAAMV